MYDNHPVPNNPIAQHNDHQCGGGKAASVPLTEDQLKGIFRRFDTNKDGQFTRQELTDAFHSLGSKFPSWRAFRALHHADANGDGFISKDEFSELLNYAIKLGYVVN
ncbi:hypothetical protein LWI28_012310 [Acer negundo]|uniref:EF-hand domain-containing protein n=1 Tax=Acer negundo TaxID=4023 RepID=A0AAD5JSL9_ACENE|nr:hypothetical protein LWI28_012310 [Acer negundo]KAK4860070.1 hypothetical protein QYF36_016890 [Acer negundo]